MVYLFLAPGFEEAEALVPCDLLRRAGVEVKLVGVGGPVAEGAHGIRVACDVQVEEAATEGLQMVVLPGGMPGTRNLQDSRAVQGFITHAFEKGLYVGAICAAPMVLGQRGLLRGRRVTCYPGYEKYLEGADVTGGAVEADGRLITARGMGVAHAFGLALVEALCGAAKAQEIRAAAVCP